MPIASFSNPFAPRLQYFHMNFKKKRLCSPVKAQGSACSNIASWDFKDSHGENANKIGPQDNLTQCSVSQFLWKVIFETVFNVYLSHLLSGSYLFMLEYAHYKAWAINRATSICFYSGKCLPEKSLFYKYKKKSLFYRLYTVMCLAYHILLDFLYTTMNVHIK